MSMIDFQILSYLCVPTKSSSDLFFYDKFHFPMFVKDFGASIHKEYWSVVLPGTFCGFLSSVSE
jgi:hypothetical protein